MSRTWSDARSDARKALHAKDYSRAEGFLVEAEALLQQASGTEGEDVARATVLGTSAELRIAEGRLDEAIALARRALEHERRAQQPGIFVANRIMFLAQTVWRHGGHDEAASLIAEAIPLFVATFGEDHHEVRFLRQLLAAAKARRPFSS